MISGTASGPPSAAASAFPASPRPGSGSDPGSPGEPEPEPDRLPTPSRWMFAQDFAVVPRPYEEVTAALCASGGALLVAAVDAARLEAERLRGRVGPGTWPAVLSPAVAVRVRPLRATSDGMVLDFDGDEGDHPALLQRFEGDLDAAPFGSAETAVAIRWRYQPSAIADLRRSDEPLLQRIVEATLRALLRSACSALG